MTARPSVCDIPIGLPELGPRSCDLEARRRLGRAASSVFLTPVRAVLHSTTYREAPGALQRLCALSSTMDVQAALAAAPTSVDLDDALDALAAVWSARRFAAGTAETLGGEPDGRGQPMRIVAVVAKRIGLASGECGPADVVDAHIALLARDHRTAVITSDREDILLVAPDLQEGSLRSEATESASCGRWGVL